MADVLRPRPCTAPAGVARSLRAAPERWTEVDVLLQDVLMGAAAAASDVSRSAAVAAASAAASRRPQTACVCARPLGIVHIEDNDEDSDGGSMDGEDDEGFDPAAPRIQLSAGLRAIAEEDPSAVRRPGSGLTTSSLTAGALAGRSASSASAAVTPPRLLKSRSGAAAEVLSLEESGATLAAPEPEALPQGMSRGQWLLLNGLTPRQQTQGGYPAPAATPAAKAQPPVASTPLSAASPPATPGKVQRRPSGPLPASLGDKLPRQCPFLGARAVGTVGAPAPRTPGKSAASGGAPANPSASSSASAGRLATRPKASTAGLSSGAARMRSHVSWSQFTPSVAGRSDARSKPTDGGLATKPIGHRKERQLAAAAAVDGMVEALAAPTSADGAAAAVAGGSAASSSSPSRDTGRAPPAAAAAAAAAASASSSSSCSGRPGSAQVRLVGGDLLDVQGDSAAAWVSEAMSSAPALSAAAATGKAALARAQAAAMTSRPRSGAADAMPAPAGSAEAAQEITPAVAAPATSSEQPQKRRGPKYVVVPGAASRPAAVAPGSLAKKAPRDLVVLEFRTEPRVVPASRHGGAAAHEKDRHASRNFRPRSRQWAAEREGLCPLTATAAGAGRAVK
eukprot:TRINITY_DN3125_c1_g1_i2.p1 TRINITY_DN3125_c1_g1~~TRINITY_DN3125_c1_g1_i2.p1  ORF type:complete len:623 (-),score=142.05 TRINITY_DN3125_c1_g1_i2:202-2070(-)